MFLNDAEKLYDSCYFKMLGQVIIFYFSCGKTAATGWIVDKEPVFNLPEGFRPTKNIEMPATCQIDGSKCGCSLYISSDGNVSPVFTGLNNTVRYLYGSGSFLAAQ